MHVFQSEIILYESVFVHNCVGTFAYNLRDEIILTYIYTVCACSQIHTVHAYLYEHIQEYTYMRVCVSAYIHAYT